MRFRLDGQEQQFFPAGLANIWWVPCRKEKFETEEGLKGVRYWLVDKSGGMRLAVLGKEKKGGKKGGGGYSYEAQEPFRTQIPPGGVLRNESQIRAWLKQLFDLFSSFHSVSDDWAADSSLLLPPALSLGMGSEWELLGPGASAAGWSAAASTAPLPIYPVGGLAAGATAVNLPAGSLTLAGPALPVSVAEGSAAAATAANLPAGSLTAVEPGRLVGTAGGSATNPAAFCFPAGLGIAAAPALPMDLAGGPPADSAAASSPVGLRTATASALPEGPAAGPAAFAAAVNPPALRALGSSAAQGDAQQSATPSGEVCRPSQEVLGSLQPMVGPAAAALTLQAPAVAGAANGAAGSPRSAGAGRNRAGKRRPEPVKAASPRALKPRTGPQVRCESQYSSFRDLPPSTHSLTWPWNIPGITRMRHLGPQYWALVTQPQPRELFCRCYWYQNTSPCRLCSPKFITCVT